MSDGFKTFEELLEDLEIREVITVPRNVPRREREDIAEVLFNELVLGEQFEIRDPGRFIEKFGAFYLLFISLKGSEEWEKLKSLARSSRISSLIVLRIVLTRVFDLLDEYQKYEPEAARVIPERMAATMAEFRRLLEDTLVLWHRKISINTPQAFNVEGMIEEEPLPERIGRFQDDEGSRQFMNLLTQSLLLSNITSSVSEVENHLASLEVLTLLYPGRNWDHSMLELHKTYFANLHKYARIVERNEDLKKMLGIIGRIELESGSRSSAISSYSRSEVYSVTTSKDLQYLLPVESVKLQDPTLKNLFFARWMEGKLLTYQLAGRNWSGGAKKKKGPMIALVDTSGSMNGAPEIIAKSIILALVKHMLKEKRDVKVFLFASVDQTSEIELTDGRKMASEFLDFLNYSFEGGTDFNTALGAGVHTLKERQYRNADLLFITDGLSAVSDESVIAGMDEVKRSNVTRVYTIVIGNDNAGGMDRFSDHVYILSKADGWDANDSPANAIRLIEAR